MRLTQACHLGATAMMLAAACAGCNQSPFKIVPVSGVVSLDGEPLSGGIVNFQPIVVGSSVNAGPGSTARTDADGRYTLTTIRGEPGAVAGKHRIRIYSYSAASAKRPEGGGAAERERVPPQYNYQSNVTFDVPAAGTDKADFELKTK